MAAGSDATPPETGASEQFVANLLRALPALTQQVRQHYDRVREQEEERKKKELEIGWIGKIIGDREHAPSRVAFISIAICAFFVTVILAAILIERDKSPLLAQVTTGVFSLMVGALGFLFGQHTQPPSDRS